MKLELNSEWRETSAVDTWTGRVKPTGYEWVHRDVGGGGGIRIYHTLTEDCTWLHVNAHAIYQDGSEERVFTLNTRISSQEDFDNIITQIHNRYARH